MSDDHEQSGGGGHNSEHGPAHDLSELGEGVGEVTEGIAGLIPDEDGTAHDVREGLETASEVAETVAKGAEALDKLQKGIQGGDLGDIGGGLGSATDAARHIVPEGEVADVLAGAGQIARGLGQLTEAAQGMVDALSRETHNVHYHVEVDGVEASWTVRSVHFSDGIGGLPSCSVEAVVAAHTFAEETELLGHDTHVTIERGERQRSFKGVVRHARLRPNRNEQIVHLEVSPALWLLSQTSDSRVYQDLTIPDLVERVFGEFMEPQHRTVRSDLTEDYSDHEYLVQHRESHFEFLSRLCDEEGIWFYFDHDGDDHEVLVLADSNDNRPRIAGGDEGRIQYTASENTHGEEVISHVHRHREIGPTDSVRSGYDWTNPGLNVRHDATGRGEWRGPPLEVHDHHHAHRLHEYDEGGGQYRSNTVDRQTRIHTERLDLNRSRWSFQTTVVDVRPGHTFELAGTDDHDGEYLITRVSATGTVGTHGGFHATITVIPRDMPYRPPAPQRRLMQGPETAIVTGPAGEEIHTDRHGRVKVQFHWDRQGARDEHSSAWIRVAQTWAGPGWGTMFIPRIGMEVVVSFLGGDPDRPIVTGCIYNGQNTVPYELPEHKTRSTIKTNSSLGGGGYNELRFEDKKGEEEIFIHAEKDFNEVVEHCHSTHVKVDQSNTVDHDQTETVRNDQTLTVENNRTKTVEVNESNTIQGNRTTTVGPDGGDDTLVVKKNRAVRVEGPRDDLWLPEGDRTTVLTQGKYDIATKGRFQIKQKQETHFELKESVYLSTPGRVQIKAGDDKVRYVAEPGGHLLVRTKDTLLIDSDADQTIKSRGGDIKVTTPQEIVVSADTSVTLVCGGSSIKLDASGIEIAGPSIKINATSGITEIDAHSQVKIKC